MHGPTANRAHLPLFFQVCFTAALGWRAGRCQLLHVTNEEAKVQKGFRKVTLHPEGLQLTVAPPRHVDVAKRTNKGQIDLSWVTACLKEATGPVRLEIIYSQGVGCSSPVLLAEAAPMDSFHMSLTS